MLKRLVVFLNGGVGRRMVPILLAGLWFATAWLAFLGLKWLSATDSDGSPLNHYSYWPMVGITAAVAGLVLFWGLTALTIDNRGLRHDYPSIGHLVLIFLSGVLFPIYMFYCFATDLPVLVQIVPMRVLDWIRRRTGLELRQW